MILRRHIHLLLSPRPQASLPGWTLTETVSVGLIVGILASLAILNTIGIMQRMQVKDVLATIKGALQEAQRNAIKTGQSCRVTMDTISSPARLSASPAGCMSEAVIVLEGINFVENFPGTNINFSHKGTTTNLGTIVVELPNTSTQKDNNPKRCLVVSNLLGIIRSGDYTETTHNGTNYSISSQYCQTTI